MKTAIIIGATGLVGSNLLDLLLQDERFGRVKVFTRRPTGASGSKLEEHIVDFDHPEEWGSSVSGDILFSAMGTTIRKAGSKDAQYLIDHTYQYRMAEAAAKSGVGTYVLVSSAGASPSSKIFYSKMKGELEEDVKKLPFGRIRILQPGILDGDRKESRPMERAMISVARSLNYIPGLKKYRPIHARMVAQRMISSALDETPGIRVYTLEEVLSDGH
jgi:uncharacterized protein YbjT (DUF2867 family)